MNDFNKNNFFTVLDKASENRKFFLKINGKMIEVSKEVYYVYYNSYRKELRENKKNKEYGLVSLDEPLFENFTLLDTLGEESNTIDTFIHNEKLKAIFNAINSLPKEEKNLITELLINEKKERELAEQYQISQQLIHYRKRRIINKIKDKIKKF